MPRLNDLPLAASRNTLLAALFSLVIALHYLYFRSGLATDHQACLTAFSLSQILLLLPTQLRRLPGLPLALDNEGALTLLTMLGLAALSYLFPAGALLYPLAALGAALFLLALAQLRPMNRFLFQGLGLLLCLGWVLFMAHEAAIVYLNGVTTPHYLERLLVGEQLVDTLYHSAITAMFKTFNLSSTGLDGLELHRYHVGSHWFFARLATLGNVAPLAFYSVCVPILIIPWFYKTLIGLASEVRQWAFGTEDLPLSSWLVLIVSVGMLKMDRLFKVFTSESFGFGLILAFAFCSMLLALCRNWETLRKNTAELAASLALLFLCCLFATLSKFSVGWFLCCVIGWSWLRLGGWRRLVPTLTVGLTAAAVLAATKLMLPMNNVGGFEFFRWIIQQELDSVGPFLKHIQAHHTWAWGLPLLVFVKNRSLRWSAMTRPDKLAIEFVIVLTVASLAPTMVMDVGGENTFSVTRWLALVACMAWMAALDFQGFMRLKEPYTKYALWALTGYLLLGTAQVSVEKWGECLAKVEKNRHNYAEQLASYEADPAFVQRRAIIERLVSLRDLPEEHKRSTAVYIPKAMTGYWNWRPEEMNKGPKTMSYVAPALSEHAQIFGVPEDRTPGPFNYGLLSYPEDRFKPGPAPGQDVGEYARQRGFEAVLTIAPQPLP